jgi:hypothetical protein
MREMDLPRGNGKWIPRSQKRDLHPSDENLSLGNPDLGHPADCRLRAE